MSSLLFSYCDKTIWSTQLPEGSAWSLGFQRDKSSSQTKQGAWQQAGRHGVGATGESSHLDSQTGSRESTRDGKRLLKHQACPQWRTSSKKVIPPHPSLIVPPTGEHVFKGLRLMGNISFKSSQVVIVFLLFIWFHFFENPMFSLGTIPKPLLVPLLLTSCHFFHCIQFSFGCSPTYSNKTSTSQISPSAQAEPSHHGWRVT